MLPEPRGEPRHDLAGLAFESGRGLDLDVQETGVAQAKVGNVLQARQRFARKAARVPAARIELRQNPPRVVAGDRAGAGAQLRRRVRGAPERVVVQQERHAIAGEFDVAFEHAITLVGPDAQGRERVFRSQFAGAAMRDPARVGPASRGDLHGNGRG